MLTLIEKITKQNKDLTLLLLRKISRLERGKKPYNGMGTLFYRYSDKKRSFMVAITFLFALGESRP